MRAEKLYEVILEPFPRTKKLHPVNGKPYLNVSEIYVTKMDKNTNYLVIRLQGCTLDCKDCNIKGRHTDGNPYTFDELDDMITLYYFKKLADAVREHNYGPLTPFRLLFTGGNPLLQQTNLIRYIEHIANKYKFLPFITIETEGTINPIEDLVKYVSTWWTNFKFEHTGNQYKRRVHPEVLKRVAALPESLFFTSIHSFEDLNTIKDLLIDELSISKNQIYLVQGKNKIIELLDLAHFANYFGYQYISYDWVAAIQRLL